MWFCFWMGWRSIGEYLPIRVLLLSHREFMLLASGYCTIRRLTSGGSRAYDRVVGFDEIGNTDKFATAVLETRLKASGTFTFTPSHLLRLRSSNNYRTSSHHPSSRSLLTLSVDVGLSHASLFSLLHRRPPPSLSTRPPPFSPLLLRA